MPPNPGRNAQVKAVPVTHPIPVATKMTGLKPVVEAVREFGPSSVPRIQAPTCATPDVLVVTEPPEIVPPPLVTVNETTTPGIPAPRWSFTFTEGSSVTASPATSLNAVLEFAVMLVATGGSETGGAVEVSPPPQAANARPRDTLA